MVCILVARVVGGEVTRVVGVEEVVRSVETLIEIAVKAVFGGVLVVVFALISETLSPKRFAGIFSAAPSIAMAGLAVTLVIKGNHDATRAATGAIFGAVALLGYCLVAGPALGRWGALRGAAVALVVWLVLALPAVWILI